MCLILWEGKKALHMPWAAASKGLWSIDSCIFQVDETWSNKHWLIVKSMLFGWPQDLKPRSSQLISSLVSACHLPFSLLSRPSREEDTRHRPKEFSTAICNIMQYPLVSQAKLHRFLSLREWVSLFFHVFFHAVNYLAECDHLLSTARGLHDGRDELLRAISLCGAIGPRALWPFWRLINKGIWLKHSEVPQESPVVKDQKEP